MALVKCPECGKENVSDSAETCPECGYKIREHFEKLQKDAEREARIQERFEQESKIIKPPAPPAPTVMIAAIVFSFIGVLLTGWFIDNDLSELAAFCILGLFITVAFVFLGLKWYLDERKEYNQLCELMEEAPEQYKKRELDRIRAKVTLEELLKEEDMKRASLMPHCPYCNSTRIEKISTANRLVSVEMFGLASGKIAKQYKCKDCKHMW